MKTSALALLTGVLLIAAGPAHAQQTAGSEQASATGTATGTATSAQPQQGGAMPYYSGFFVPGGGPAIPGLPEGEEEKEEKTVFRYDSKKYDPLTGAPKPTRLFNNIPPRNYNK